MTGRLPADAWETCGVCGRAVLIEGAVNRMEAAVNSSGRPLAIEWLAGWVARPRKSRTRKLADLLAALEDFAEAPERLRLNELNSLGRGLWELKVGSMRLPFVAAPCPGSLSPAANQRQLVLPQHVPTPGPRAHCARATHGFEKRTERTPRRELEIAQAIGREDAFR
jgi:hypothetical protein